MGEVLGGDNAHEVEDVYKGGLGGEEVRVGDDVHTEAIIWKE